MSIDTLITIGVIIYIIFAIRKALSSGKKEGNDEKPSGWKQKIQDFVDEVKEEIEKANLEHQQAEKSAGHGGDDSFWDDIQPDESDRKSSTYYEEDEEYGETPPKVISQSVFYEPEPPPLDDEPEESHKMHPELSTDSPVYTRHCAVRHSALKMKKNDLKKAVVWSEILSKPVGLRD